MGPCSRPVRLQLSSKHTAASYSRGILDYQFVDNVELGFFHDYIKRSMMISGSTLHDAISSLNRRCRENLDGNGTDHTGKQGELNRASKRTLQ